MWVEITVTADELTIISGTIGSCSMRNYVKFFFNKYHQFHYLISVQTAWKDTLELHLMSKKYVDKEYVSGCISVLPLTWSLVKHAIPSSMGKIYTLSKRLKSQPGKEVHILNKFLLWILISQSKGFFFESSWPFL